MEIVTYVLEGAVAHKDSMGNGSTIVPGEVQRMSAGRGVLHSEFNPSKDETLHLLQIWIFPEKEGIAPSYEQKRFDESEKRNKLRLVASPTGAEGSVTINQDARIYATLLDDEKEITYRIATGRHVWIHVARGSAELNGHALSAGDGAAFSEETALTLKSKKNAEILVFDLA
jgi:redox-sensitive bicupin YhaK (pirin superfamily)